MLHKFEREHFEFTSREIERELVVQEASGQTCLVTIFNSAPAPIAISVRGKLIPPVDR